MSDWAAAELQYADLGDVRRKKRLIRLVSDLANQPCASIPQASGDWAATQAAYDFWSSPHVKASSIIQAHQSSTLNRIKAEAVVIAPQDTTELNFTHHPSKKGMGYLDNRKSSGLKVHSVFCSARYHPDLPADTILETYQWQALYCTIHHHPHPPDSPPN